MGWPKTIARRSSTQNTIFNNSQKQHPANTKEMKRRIAGIM
jgi:hypothetical protein